MNIDLNRTDINVEISIKQEETITLMFGNIGKTHKFMQI